MATTTTTRDGKTPEQAFDGYMKKARKMAAAIQKALDAHEQAVKANGTNWIHADLIAHAVDALWEINTDLGGEEN